MEIPTHYDLYALLAIVFNVFPILIFICILITLPGIRSKGKNYKLLFTTVVFGILSSVGECLSYAGDLIWKDRTLALIFGFSNFLFIVLFRAVEEVFILNYTDSGLKVNRIAKKIVYPLLCILILSVTVPPIASQVYYIPENGYVMEYGSLFLAYCLLQTAVVICSIIVIIVNRKKMGTRATIVLILLQTIAIATNLLLDDQSDLSLTFTSAIILIFYISIYQGSILEAAENEKILAEQNLLLADIKTKAMLSQVKPHFIYNTLSSIAMLCTREPTKAKELTLDFSDYLRSNLDTLGKEGLAVCSFEDELEHIKTYLSIESVRFGDRLKVKYDTPETNFSVPALSIQPIVENAVKHGICHKKGGGTVTISTDKTDDGYKITVNDDGIGFDRETALNDGNVHIGIENIEKRIAIFGGTVNIESKIGVGTTVTVQMKEVGAL